MNSQGLEIETILKNFADSAAVNFHEFSKKCILTMNNIINQQQKRRDLKKNRLLDQCSRIVEAQRVRQTPLAPVVPEAPKQSQLPQSQPQQSAESRIARINRIKQTIQVRKNEQEGKQWTQQELDIALQQFAKDLRPQILNKYPSAPADKVQKVILQKWSTIDSAKKDAYIAKILAKRAGQSPKNLEKEDEAIEREQESEVKREANEDQQQEVPPQKQHENRELTDSQHNYAQ